MAKLIGTLWWVSSQQIHWTRQQWAKELDPLQRLGMNTIILNGPSIGEKLAPGTADPAITLFQEGDRRQLHFFLDTLAAPNWWTLPDSKHELARARRRVETLETRYGSYRSFYGFYVPYEIYVAWGKQRKLAEALYRGVAKECKHVAPNKPVLISPFFILDKQGYLGNFRWATPKEYKNFWTNMLRHTRVDIVALQDSGEHLSFYTLSERKPFFEAMKAACDATHKTFWANVETGELKVDSYKDYVSRFGKKTSVNDPKLSSFWRGVPAKKLKAKLEFVAHYTNTAITWGYQQFIRPSLNPKAAALYKQYLTVLKHQSQKGLR